MVRGLGRARLDGESGPAALSRVCAPEEQMPRQKSTHVDDPRQVGLRLKKAREAAGVSQRKLAFAGCSPAYISRIEAGDRIPSLQILRELARRLDVDAEFLATGSRDVGDGLVEAELALRLGELDRAESAFDELADEASADERIRALTGLGDTAYRRGELTDAMAHYERALAESDGDPIPHPALAESVGRAYTAAGRLPEAIAIFRRALAQPRASDDLVQTIRFASMLGNALSDNGELDEARRVVSGALEQAGEMTDPKSRARLYGAQARALRERGRTNDASRYAQLALETLRLAEDGSTVAQAHRLLAHIHLEGGDPARAEAELDAGRPLIETAATRAELAFFELEEARLHARRGEVEQARSLASSIAERLDDATPQDAGRAYVLLGEVFETLGELERAGELYELAIARLERLPTSRYLLTAQRRLAAVLEKLDRPDLALDALKRALGMQEGIAAPGD